MHHVIMFILYFFLTAIAMFIARSRFSRWISTKNLKNRFKVIAVHASIISASLIIPFLNTPNTSAIKDIQLKLILVCFIYGFSIQFYRSKTKIPEYKKLDRCLEAWRWKIPMYFFLVLIIFYVRINNNGCWDRRFSYNSFLYVINKTFVAL